MAAVMRATVVVFPGSNAESELVRTIRDAANAETSMTWHTDTTLPAGIDLVALPGGFSYGDYLRSGALAKACPIVPAIVAHAARGGYVLGVCNGFQILTEVGLLPGALTRNSQRRFECGDWHMKVTADGPFTRAIGDVWKLPVAHGEGRYQADETTLRRLEDEGLIGLRYCLPDGTIDERGNPNGSLHGIAGIYGGKRRNVFGLMPHPERMSEAVLGGADGRKLFEAVLSQAA
jgi:phosphoribosylformylglycinamidine synthase